MISLSFCIFTMVGGACYTKFVKDGVTDECVHKLAIGFVARSFLQMILSSIQLYSLLRIMMLVRENERRLRDTCCAHLSYILIIGLQTVMNLGLIIPSLNLLQNPTNAGLTDVSGNIFVYTAAYGLVILPWIIKQIYA